MAITIDGADNKLEIGANATGPSSLRLYEDTDNGTNYVSIIAPSAVTSNGTITLPDGTGTLVVNGINSSIVSGTSKAFNWNGSSSNTLLDFNSIPSWAKRITVMFSDISTNGTSNMQIQLGDSGGFETSGYAGTAWLANTVNTAMSAGFLVSGQNAAAYVWNGSIILSHFGSNTWILQGTLGLSSAAAGGVQNGKKTLSDVLTQLRITTVNGTDTFDAGTVNILYE